MAPDDSHHSRIKYSSRKAGFMVYEHSKRMYIMFNDMKRVCMV